MPKVDMGTPETPVAERYVKIPEQDLSDHVFPTIRINHMEFMPGETYLLKEPIASSVEERVRAYQRYDLNLLRPTPDKEAIRIMGKHGVAKANGQGTAQAN